MSKPLLFEKLCIVVTVKVGFISLIINKSINAVCCIIGLKEEKEKILKSNLFLLILEFKT